MVVFDCGASRNGGSPLCLTVVQARTVDHRRAPTKPVGVFFKKPSPNPVGFLVKMEDKRLGVSF